jgi:hypothetical protein
MKKIVFMEVLFMKNLIYSLFISACLFLGVSVVEDYFSHLTKSATGNLALK